MIIAGENGGSLADPTFGQVRRILDSKEFYASDRDPRFLRYLVEEMLAGRGDRIKAYSIATSAFDRDESFDPQSDPIVRLEASRLCRSLDRYYLTAGRAIPSGSRYERAPILFPMWSRGQEKHRRPREEREIGRASCRE